MAAPSWAVAVPQLLRVGDMGPTESLHDLLTEYVNRTYAVLADFVGQAPIMRHGVMSPTVWTKLEAIKRMSKKMKIPTEGWNEIYLLLSTLPAGWVPGNPIVSACLMIWW